MATPKPAPVKSKKIKPWLIVVIALIALLVGFGGYILYRRYIDFNKITTIFKPKTVTETLVANKLDGIKVAPDKAARHPLAIMIENHPTARPQTGLDKASIVYEAITEGGITRFMAIYGPYDADKVGPVRSARTYYIDWLSEFNAFYAHCGGNLDALDKIKQDDIQDLDQFSVGDAAYWREPQAGKAIEHTMYTSINKLYNYAFNTKKWPQTADFTGLKFIDPIEVTLRPPAQKIQINFSSASYAVTWQYDPQTNKYSREMGGTPHKDKITDLPLASSNIIVMQVDRWEAQTAINENGWGMQTIGSGQAKIFSQGKEIDGSWKKTDRQSRTIYSDSQGNEISFVPGQFWIEVTPPDVFSGIKSE